MQKLQISSSGWLIISMNSGPLLSHQTGWGVTFNDSVIAMAILDRLLHHSQPVTIMGDSFRLKDIIQ